MYKIFQLIDGEVVPLWEIDPTAYFSALDIEAEVILNEPGYFGTTDDQRREYIQDNWRAAAECMGEDGEELHHEIPDDMWDEYVRDLLATCNTAARSSAARALRAIPSEKRAEQSRINGSLGGRPRRPPLSFDVNA